MIEKKSPKFKSFVWGGFECLYAKTEGGKRVNQLNDTKHDKYCSADYKLIKKIGITTVREGLSWNGIDKGKGIYDFSEFIPMMQKAKEEGIEQIWDLNHFDYPEGLDPFSKEFVSRFARYAKECIKVIKKYQKGTIYIAPVNEISFFAFISADKGNWAPYAKKRGVEFKKQLVRAAIAAMDEIWEVDRNVRFIHVDPIFRRTPLKPDKLSQKKEKEFISAKFQAWDMLAGKIFPELGGDPKYLDIIGANYYYYNQEYILPKKPDGPMYLTIPWKSKDRVSLQAMLSEVYNRYKRPIVISETGGWGALRRMWWPRIFRELNDAIKSGIPIYGICAYPIIDRADWTHGHLTNSGLWYLKNNDSALKRIPHEPTIRVVKNYIKSLSN
jgi:beta-glucosidase/6-phospho-beta-glucosidase/beta-galactosidase